MGIRKRHEGVFQQARSFLEHPYSSCSFAQKGYLLGNSKPRRRHEKRAREISQALVRMCAKGCSIGAGLAISAL
jgi:hypothetical protein